MPFIRDLSCLRLSKSVCYEEYIPFNIDSATCEDYKNLIKEVQKKVLEDSGVELECEVKILGE